MGTGNCRVRRVVVGNVVLMLLHHYFQALAQPQPSPSSPFVNFSTEVTNSTEYNLNSHFTIKGRIREAAVGNQSGNVSYTAFTVPYKASYCIEPIPPSINSTHYDTPTDSEFTCFQSTPIQFKVDNATSSSVFSFSSKFVVSMYIETEGDPSSNSSAPYNNVTNGLQGFTFALLPLDFNPFDAGDGGYLGLLNATSNGSNQSHIVAVEFDFKGNPEFSDPVQGYHIGLNINSMNSTSWTLLPGPAPNVQSWTLQVWIEYDGSSHMLTVTTLDITSLFDSNTYTSCVTDQQRPPDLGSNRNIVGAWTLHSQKVDLSSVLNEFMYVGFTSSGLSSHLPDVDPPIAIYPWSFRTSNSSPPAPSAPFKCSTTSLFHVSFFQKHAFNLTLTIVLTGLLALSVLYAISYMYYSRWVERRGWRFNIDDDHLGASDPHKFTYKELALATNNFDEKHALGRGGFGSVYKGFLPGNKQDVAVKRVSAESKQGEREFLAEVMIIGKLRHRNLVRLQGWCHERGELLLVYDYMPNGSVDKLLFDNHVKPQDSPGRSTANPRLDETVSLKNFAVKVVDPKFPWERRLKVIVDVATALVYLHTECEERIIHRDVKAANVMLDAKFNARLGDFGLARAYNHSLLTPESTNVAGTFGYLAPELFHTGKQTEKTDVYSFGAFVLEVACGRKPIFHEGDEMGVLVDHVWRMWGDGKILTTADPQLEGMFDEGEMRKVLCLGLVCSHPSPAMRPSMRQVLCILTGEISLPEVPSAKPRVSEELERSLSEDMLTSTDSISQSYSPRARVRKTGMADGLAGIEVSDTTAWKGNATI